MFSITTMASSTTKPVEMVKAISDKLSMLNPSRYITPKVPTSESGTATDGMMVAQTSRRKRKTTSTTSTTLIMSDISTSWTLERMVVVRSTATSILMVGGMADRK